MFNYKRVAALEKGIERLFGRVYEIEGVMRPGAWGLFPDFDKLADLNRWVDLIQESQKNKALENKIKSVVQENCPNKKKGAK